jgi:hypothetical protein
VEESFRETERQWRRKKPICSVGGEEQKDVGSLICNDLKVGSIRASYKSAEENKT